MSQPNTEAAAGSDIQAQQRPEERYEARYEAEWEEASINPAQLLEAELRQWCEEVFDDVKPSFFGPMGRVSLPAMARLRYANRKVTWFTDPVNWNKAQRAVLRHALGHDPDKLATHTFRENEYWLKFHLNIGPQPRLKRFAGAVISPGSALLGAHGSSKTVTLCAPLKPAQQKGFVVKSSAYEDGLLQESLALRQLPKGLVSPRELGVSLGELNQGRASGASLRARVFQHQNLQSLQAGYNLSTIPRLNNLLPLAQAALSTLVDTAAEPTSLAAQAETLRHEVEASGVSPALKARLSELLKRVNDRTPLQPSRVHGDFRRANLLAVPDGLDFEAQSFAFELGVIDWELSRPQRLGIHDFIHLLLDLQKADLNKRPIAEMFGEGELEPFCTALRQADLPGSEASPSEILALHLATFAFDRAWGFGGRGGGRDYAEKLSGAWPFD